MGADASRGLNAVAAWHLQVHEDDVGFVCGGKCDGLFSVGSGRDDRDLRHELEQHHEPVAHSGLIVGYDDADRCALCCAHAGMHSSTSQPPSTSPARTRPWSSAARSRMPAIPYPPPSLDMLAPEPPIVRTSSRSSDGW